MEPALSAVTQPSNLNTLAATRLQEYAHMPSVPTYYDYVAATLLAVLAQIPAWSCYGNGVISTPARPESAIECGIDPPARECHRCALYTHPQPNLLS